MLRKSHVLLILLSLFPLNLSAGDEPVTTWLISSDKRIQGTAHLVKLIDGEVKEKILLGRGVAYLAIGNRIVISGSQENKRIIRSFDKNTGDVLTQCEESGVSFPGSIMLDASPTSISGLLLEGHDQLMFSSYELQMIPLITGEVSYGNFQYTRTHFYVVDLKTGKVIAHEKSDFVPFTEGLGGYPDRIRDRTGFRLKNGIFLEYLPEEKKFEHRLIPEFNPLRIYTQLDKKWNYLEDVGFIRREQDQLTILSNTRFKPLRDQSYPWPKGIDPAYAHLRKVEDSIILTIFNSTKPDEAINPSTRIFQYDLTEQKEIFQKEFTFSSRSQYVSENMTSFYLTDPQNKVIYHYNKESGKLLKIDHSWSGHTVFVPCFTGDS